MSNWGQILAIGMLAAAVASGFYVAFQVAMRTAKKDDKGEVFNGPLKQVVWIALFLLLLSSTVFSISGFRDAPPPDFSCSTEQLFQPTVLHCINRNQNVDTTKWLLEREGTLIAEGEGNAFNKDIDDTGTYQVTNIITHKRFFAPSSAAKSASFRVVTRPAPDVRILSRPFVFKQFLSPGEKSTQEFDVSSDEKLISAKVRNINTSVAEYHVFVRDNRAILEVRGRGDSNCKITPFGSCLPHPEASILEGVVELEVERRVP